MSISAQDRPLLALTPTGPHGSRSSMTCHYRCGNACDQPLANRSDTGHVRDEITRVVQRRSVLRGAAVGTGALVVGGLTGTSAATASSSPQPAGRPGHLGRTRFSPVAPNVRDAVVVPDGFRHDVLIRWGDPVVLGAPKFDAHRQTPEAAALQFGYNNDYVGVVELSGRRHRDRALLVVNHEYTDEELMFPAGTYDDATIKRIAMASHGMAVVEIKRGRTPGSWRQVNHRNASRNRRITADTPFRMDGPAVGDERLRTSADPGGRTVHGTIGNCAGGTTPWGTVLSGEENFNFYFDSSGELDERYAESYARYGITGEGGRGWSEVDPRFDLSREPHEPYRFGWIVELDPLRPHSTPRKHSMLGRFKHEGANVTIADDGRAVVYMGDDERGEYLYKFVSRDRYRERGSRARAHNLTLLQHGTLFVARLRGDGTEDGVYDGTGEWIPLTSDTTSYVAGMSVADVLLDTRLAADTVRPTRMDRPEDVEPNPVNGKVYAALTNNSQRGSTFAPDEANPVTRSMTRPAIGAPLVETSGNRNGYVLELSPAKRDHTAEAFTWDLFLVCGDPEAQETYFGGFDKGRVSPISCPDNVAFDEAGNLWLATDGNMLGSNDGIFRVPVAGVERGNVRQFLTVPRGAEACGPLITDQSRSLFFAVQHPGEIDGASFEAPASTWPHTDDFPRPSVCVAYAAR
ncbi:PhoX family phosphatase [Nocardioides sp.]|uniref:PhoX family protein n=1 Tax=Nocardioides sp. TaxID=35761 RepID=UPI003564FE84